MSDRIRVVRAVATLLTLALSPGCAPSLGSISGTTDTLTIGAYSVVREPFHDAILPAFAARWKSATGRDVRFEESYTSSGAQSRAIASGFDADVAVLSLEGDIQRLVERGHIQPSWNAGPARGMITRGLVVIGVRAGNPKHVRDWSDLARADMDVLYPDPKTSGGARWIINAIYGAGLLTRDTPDPRAASDLLARVQARVVNMDGSGRQSVATFERGTGDAVVTYENELLLRRKLTGQEAPYVIPPATLLIEGPAAVVDASVARHGNRKVAEAFLAFLRTDEAQTILADHGFRPLDPKLEPPGRAPLPPRLFRMADLGGWSTVNSQLYEPGGIWDALFTGQAKGRDR